MATRVTGVPRQLRLEEALVPVQAAPVARRRGDVVAEHQVAFAAYREACRRVEEADWAALVARHAADGARERLRAAYEAVAAAGEQCAM